MDQEVHPSANNNKSNMDPLGQLKQIKDISFGPEMDDLVGRIASLEEKLATHEKHTGEELSKLSADLGKNIEDTQAALSAQIEKVVSTFEQKTDRLNQTQVKRKELGKLLVNLGEKFLKE